MKNFILLLIIIAIVFVAWNRNRIYLRDPLGSVIRDGAKEPGTQLFINYANDVLLENDNPPMYVTLVQHGQHIGTPAMLRCMHFVACLADADISTLALTDKSSQVESMSSKAVAFRDGNGRETVVSLH